MSPKQIIVVKTIAANVAVVSTILILSFARIDGIIAPFAWAFLFATIFIPRVSKIVAGMSAFLFTLITAYGRAEILVNIYAVTVFFVALWVMPKLTDKFGKKKFWKKYHAEICIAFAFYVLSTALDIIFAYADLTELYIALINLVGGVIFFGVSIIFINAMVTRFNRIPWTFDAKVCAGVFIIILSLGLGGVDYQNFNIHKFVTVFVILVAIKLFDARATLVIATVSGLGLAFLHLELTYVAAYSVLALCGLAFRDRWRICSCISVFVADLVLGYFFGIYWGYELYDVLPVGVACVLAMCLPNTLTKYFDFTHRFLSGYLVSKNTINRNRQGIYKRIENLAGVFLEMQNIYKSMVMGTCPPETVAKMVAGDIVGSVCANCEHRPNCRRDGASAKSVDGAIEKLCSAGVGRGKVDITAVNADLTMRCNKVTAVINKANAILQTVKAKDHRTQNLDAGKVLMAGLLAGMSKLCKNFAADMCSGVVFDTERALKVRDALLNAGIVASDCLITHNQKGDYSVSVLVPRLDAFDKKIENVISAAAGHKMAVDTIDDAETAGFSIVTVKTAPRYSLVFGVGQVSKNFNPTCGDTFTVLKITHNQSMIAVCDGMGVGERAHRASVLALSLVENFYKAGFPNEIIMDMVNQLLILTEQEVFSAIDVAVFSLVEGSVNFIKVGGVDGYIKRSNEVEVVEAGSLPIGIVEEMSPKITRAHLNAGDMVVLCSDGVADSFGDRVALGNFINNVDSAVRGGTMTPQKIADEIIAECLRRTDKVAIDDCTVLVAQLTS